MAKAAEKRTIILENGEKADAIFPVIVSASRSTDIPAFYSDWFFERLKKGYSAWINPFNRQKYYISYADTKFIVFWSKNPAPLLKHLDYLNERGIGCYIQYTLNNYEENGLEGAIPALAERINTFKSLVGKLGKGAVIWRFDPLILTQNITIDMLLTRIRHIGNQLHAHTEKFVFSFADILSYKKVKANLEANNILYKDWTPAQMYEFSERLVELNKSEAWNLKLASCGEMQTLPAGIEHNNCVDERLILRLSQAPELWEFLGAEACRKDLFGNVTQGAIDLGEGKFVRILKNNRDNGQRMLSGCGCAKSKDIGQYNTCPHLCEYCYANYNKETALRNYAAHKAKPFGELIVEKVI